MDRHKARRSTRRSFEKNVKQYCRLQHPAPKLRQVSRGARVNNDFRSTLKRAPHKKKRREQKRRKEGKATKPQEKRSATTSKDSPYHRCTKPTMWRFQETPQSAGGERGEGRRPRKGKKREKKRGRERPPKRTNESLRPKNRH